MPERLKGRGGTACQKGTFFGIGAPFSFIFTFVKVPPRPSGQRAGGARAPSAPPVPAAQENIQNDFFKQSGDCCYIRMIYLNLLP